VSLPNRGLAAGAAALQLRNSSRAGQTDAHTGTARPDPSAQVKTGVLSPLREDDGHYYVVAVMNKGRDRLKLATVAWLKEPLRSWLAKAETQVPVTMAAVSANYTLPVISGQSDNSISSVACTADSWTATASAPDGRDSQTAVWTGSEMIVWGGFGSAGLLNTGGRYNPGTDDWMATTTSNAPERRAYHTAVWSGSEMIVWGGLNDLGPFFLNTGGKYCAATQSPTATPTASPTATATATFTPTATPTLTPRPSPTPRPALTPRPRPTPPPRP